MPVYTTPANRVMRVKVSLALCLITPVMAGGYLMYQKALHYVHKAHLHVLYGSKNKQQLFPYTALSDWFL